MRKLVMSVFVLLLAVTTVAHAGVKKVTNPTPQEATYLYRWDTGPSTERFNNSETTETEDNWVANAFQVVAEGTRLLSVQYTLGENFTNQAVTAVIYQGEDISAPTGLVRLETVETTITGVAGSDATITFDTPVDLNEGDVFYAALLIRAVPGTLFPFHNQGPTGLGHSFFDVGPTQGAPYDLDVTDNATVLGGNHPVVHIAQGAGNLFLRVNATTTP